LILCAILVVAATYSTPFRKPEVLALRCKAIDSRGVEIYRSMGRRNLFIRLTGGRRRGEVVNHIVPLACGGCDVPSNMEWLSTAEWKSRTGPERYDCGRHPGGEW
jgi:hypothetical protein